MTARTAPNFLVVGVQKAGTTFLAKSLSEHPDVFFSVPKEIFFFNTDKVSRADFNLYLYENFRKAGDRRWVGEGSTNYFHHAHAMRHIRRHLGTETRIIVCLRHPVERLLSHYLHDYRRGRRTGKEQLHDPIFAGYLSRSFYSARLKAWSCFPHFKVMIFDDLVASGPAYYGEAAAFLDLKPQPIQDVPVNEGFRLMWRGDTLTLAASSGMGEALPAFPRAQLEELIESYASDVRTTAAMLNRDLAAWLQMPCFEQMEEKFAPSRTTSPPRVGKSR